MAEWQVLIRRIGADGRVSIHVYQEEAEVSRDAIAQAVARCTQERGKTSITVQPFGVAFREDVVRTIGFKETSQNLIL